MIIRLCYASQRHENNDHLLEDLQDILTTARNFNVRNEICGVLYYADKAFFQCLEGEKQVVETLFANIQQDQRHHQVIHLETKEIDKTCFKEWSMKYVQRNSNIQAFFKTQGQNLFAPALLNAETLDLFLNELLISKQSKVSSSKKVGLKNRGINPYL